MTQLTPVQLERLTPREREAWGLTYDHRLSRRAAGKRMGCSSARVNQLLDSARRRLNLPVTTRQKQKGYKPAAARRREREELINGWFFERWDLLIGEERELVQETTFRALDRLRVPEGTEESYLAANGSAEWVRENLSPEAYAYLARTKTASTGRDDAIDGTSVSLHDAQQDMGVIGEGEETVLLVLDRSEGWKS